MLVAGAGQPAAPPSSTSCSEHLTATTCPHSAGKERSWRYPVKKIQLRVSRTFEKNPQKEKKKSIYNSIQNISSPFLTNLETFLSFPLLGWYRRKVTDLSHHQPSA